MNSASEVTNVWGFLTSVGTIQSIIIFFIIVFILTVFILITKPSFKFGNFVISFGQNKSQNKSIEMSHSSCSHNIDFCHVVTKTAEIVTKMCYIDLKECIDRQMSYVDERLTIIKSILLNNYSKILKSKIQIDKQVIVHEDYITYHRLVESMLFEDIKNSIRQSFANDNFDQLSDVEFNMYINEKFLYIYQIGDEFMDMWYIGNKMLISREELKESVLLLKAKLYDIFVDTYEKAVKVLEEKEDRKIKLQDELDIFFEKIVGVKRRLN